MTEKENPADKLKSLMEGLTNHSESCRQAAIDRYNQRIKSTEHLTSFFESHLKKDSWLVFDEAIPISNGIAPNEAGSIELYSKTWYRELKDLALAAQGNKTLSIINHESKPKQWRVTPKAFVKWALEKEININPVLVEVIKLEKKTPSFKKAHGNTESNAQKRESILVAALAVLAAYPDKCKLNGKVSAAKIADQIEQKSDIWFGYDDIPLKRRGVEDLIRKALKTTVNQ